MLPISECDRLNEIETEIKSKIAVGNKCYYALGPMKRSSIYQSIKIRLYKTIIRRTVTYEADTWTMTSKKKILMTLERKILRKIYGTKKESEQWRIKTNEELITKSEPNPKIL